MKYDIYEHARYTVEAETANDAMRIFLADPNKYLHEVTEREVWEHNQNGRGQRFVEWDEYKEAEDNS